MDLANNLGFKFNVLFWFVHFCTSFSKFQEINKISVDPENIPQWKNTSLSLIKQAVGMFALKQFFKLDKLTGFWTTSPRDETHESDAVQVLIAAIYSGGTLADTEYQNIYDCCYVRAVLEFLQTMGAQIKNWTGCSKACMLSIN